MTLITVQSSYLIVKEILYLSTLLECQHYVKGGWDFTPQLRNESFYHNSLLSIFYCNICLHFSNETKNLYLGEDESKYKYCYF